MTPRISVLLPVNLIGACKMKTFVFSYKRVVQITVQAEDEPSARQELQAKIDAALSWGIEVPHTQIIYELFSAY